MLNVLLNILTAAIFGFMVFTEIKNHHIRKDIKRLRAESAALAADIEARRARLAPRGGPR